MSYKYLIKHAPHDLLSVLLLGDGVCFPLPVLECRCPAREGEEKNPQQIKFLFKELSDVTPVHPPRGRVLSWTGD